MSLESVFRTITLCSQCPVYGQGPCPCVGPVSQLSVPRGLWLWVPRSLWLCWLWVPRGLWLCWLWVPRGLWLCWLWVPCSLWLFLLWLFLGAGYKYK